MDRAGPFTSATLILNLAQYYPIVIEELCGLVIIHGGSARQVSICAARCLSRGFTCVILKPFAYNVQFPLGAEALPDCRINQALWPIKHAK